MTKHWKQKQKAKGQHENQAATASTTRATSSPLTSRAPIGMNNLPDELLDDIALSASPNALRALALVQRRWYAPARKQTWFAVQGIKSLLAFADVLLERPAFAHLVRHARLDGASSAPSSNVETRCCSDLASRVVGVVVQECASLRSLELGVPPQSLAAQRQLMKTVGTLPLLSSLVPSSTDHPIDLSAFAAAAPALRSLEHLEVCFESDQPASTLLLLPRCSAANLFVYLILCTLDTAALILTRLAGQARYLSIAVATQDDNEWMQLDSRIALNSALPPLITRCDGFRLHLITRTWHRDIRHLLDWPRGRGGVCFVVQKRFGALPFKTTWWINEATRCFLQVWEEALDTQNAASRRAWARRGDGWTDSLVDALGAVCREQDIELVWE